jgi:hypothetical protein
LATQGGANPAGIATFYADETAPSDLKAEQIYQPVT